MGAIVVDGVTKTYRVKVGRARVREMLPPPIDRALRSVFPTWWRRDTFSALEDVSTSVDPGESVGIVGHNGAGKTTLLRVIVGVTSPTAGDVRVSGRAAALIDALVGFHPDLTGRENVYLLGSMYGVGRRVMRDRMEKVLEFAELPESADTPVKRLSAGMVARLGFATLTALDVDILLVDEVLAVGDAAFQHKCVLWLDDFRARGGTLVFVSHNLSLVRHMTGRALWLSQGRMISDGPTSSVLAEYATAMEQRESANPLVRRGEAHKLVKAGGMNRWGAGGARVSEVRFDGPSVRGSELHVSIAYESAELDEGVFCIGFEDEGGRDIGAATSPLTTLKGENGLLQCVFRPLPLRPGIYFPIVAIVTPDGQVRDRWRMDRALVVDRDGEAPLGETFGPVEITGAWSQ
jgi:ABC-type polysaccharide/polyol phosphate transport system ATPase subunit